jgi:hypothetical protein
MIFQIEGESKNGGAKWMQKIFIFLIIWNFRRL